MKNLSSISRRNFIGKTAVTAGLSALGTGSLFGETSDSASASLSGEINAKSQARLPREVWIATVSQEGIRAETHEGMVKQMLDLVSKSAVYQPDIVCLPEFFMFTWSNQRTVLEERIELSQVFLKKVMEFARSNNCYIICPLFTREKGKIYNAAAVIDRQGNSMGEFRKMHLPLDELESGFSPGPLKPPVFKTDFGTIGVQICYDVNWNDGWQSLREQGAEIVFWPSAYPGGRKINARAFENKYVVVTSTRGNSKICDITGDVIAQNSDWGGNVVCASVNLEKILFNTWPNSKHFEDIRRRYGRKVRFTSYDEEGWTVIESLSPDVRVNDFKKEYNIMSFMELADETDVISAKRR